MYHAVKSMTVLILTFGLLAVTDAGADANWPAFRGPEARGVAEGEGLPDQWSASDNVEWTTDLPGRGWSSPIVWGGHVFLTTVVNLGTSEEPKKGLYSGGDRHDALASTHQWKVFALDLETGKVLWERQVHEGSPATSIHIKNSYASETPVTDGKQVYVFFGNLGVFCFDFDGNLIWDKKLEPKQIRNDWGTAASPVLHGDLLYVVRDNDEDSYLLALDKGTGEEVWRTARDEGSNWSTPYVWENEKRTEIVTTGTDQVRSYGLEGNLLWSLRGMSSITVATPYESNGLLYVSSGYLWDKLRPLYAIRPGAEGDISLKEGETSNAWIAWCRPAVAPYNPSTLAYENRLYVLDDRGMLSCFDAFDGSVIYENEKIPRGRRFTVSPWAYGGKVFCLNEDGTTFVIKAGESFEVLHSNILGKDVMCMSTPAIAGDRLLIRTSERLYSIRSSAN